MNRRSFIVNSAAALGASALSAATSPNNTVRIAVVGMHGRGKSHLQAFTSLPNVDLVAICDIDDPVLANASKFVAEKRGTAPTPYKDLRKLLEDKSIDAVSIATPNHQHTLQTVWACQSGKDVYVEKPCSHDMFEARQIVAAAKKYDRVVQHGTQQRSSAGRVAAEKLRGGVIGDLYMARGLCFKWRDAIGRKPAAAVPPGVHYDLWLGPAPQHEFTANRFHYNWHWFWDYGNGDIGNQGVHQMDMARWGLGVAYPVKVSATGGHFMFDDDQETPNTLTASFEFNDAGKKKLLIFEVRHWISNHEAGLDEGKPGNTVGSIFYGSKGYFTVSEEDKSQYASFLGKEQTPGPTEHIVGNHFANFIDVVRSRNQADLHAPIEEGAISTALVHLANISYRLGRTLHFDAAAYSCIGDAEATDMFKHSYRRAFEVPEKV